MRILIKCATVFVCDFRSRRHADGNRALGRERADGNTHVIVASRVPLECFVRVCLSVGERDGGAPRSAPRAVNCAGGGGAGRRNDARDGRGSDGVSATYELFPSAGTSEPAEALAHLKITDPLVVIKIGAV